MHIADPDIGGGRVRQPFTRSGEMLRADHQLSAAEVLAIPRANRRALIDGGFLEVYPHGPATSAESERFVIKVGDGKYDVIAGHKLNDTSLSRPEADRLAGRAR